MPPQTIRRGWDAAQFAIGQPNVAPVTWQRHGALGFPPWLDPSGRVGIQNDSQGWCVNLSVDSTDELCPTVAFALRMTEFCSRSKTE